MFIAINFFFLLGKLVKVFGKSGSFYIKLGLCKNLRLQDVLIKFCDLGKQI